jgi:Tfp pilus assembly protein PilF
MGARGGAIVLLLGLVLGGHGGAHAQAPPSTSLTGYLLGLDALRQGRHAEATAALTQAMPGSTDPSFWLARGVAYTLGEKFREGIEDFARARSMGLKGREPDLWTYTAQMMSGGRERSGLDNRGRGGQAWFGGAPGHIIQGRDDYPTDYASFVYYEMATPYSRGVTPAVREAMRQAGAWFANRAATRPDLAPVHLARARDLFARRDYPAVLQALAYVGALQPASPDVRYLGGASWLGLGRPATARRELTIALTSQTRAAGGYLNRAFAAARLGDATRARADLESAARYDASLDPKLKASLEQEIASHRAEGQPEALRAALEASAAAGAPLEQLVTEATALHRAMAPRRLRYDEWYQDRLRQLEDGVRAAPRTAAPYGALADFLIDEASLEYRGENVEPRHGLVPFRWQQSREAELRRAVAVCEEGLRAQPDSIAVQTVKAVALVRLGDDAGAEAVVNRVLAAAPTNPEALRLKAKFLIERASALYARASALRSPRTETSSHTETRSDGVYRVTTTRYYEPTREALATAAQLEAQAADLVRRSRAALAAALAALRGTLEGDLLSAEVEFGGGNHEAALASVQNALRRQPTSLEANQMLAQYHRRLGRTEEYERQMSVVTNLVHTSAGWMLRTAWRKLVARDQAGARAALDAARRLDPVDARVAAYTGVWLADQGNAAGAEAAYRVALALEQARLRMDEGQGGAALPREHADELATLMKMRNVLAAAHLQREPQVALDHYLPNTLLARRITRAGRGTQMFGAMLPEPGAPAVPVPAPPNAAQLMAEAHNGAGRALKALGRPQDAMQQFQAAIDLTRKPGMPGVGSGRPGDTNFAGDAGGGAVAEATLEMVKTALARGDCEGASQAMTRGGGPGLTPAMRQELNRLQFDVARCYNERRR